MIDVNFLHDFSFEKEIDDDPVAISLAGLAGSDDPVSPANFVAVGVANSVVAERICNAAAGASVVKSATGIIVNAVAVHSVLKSVTTCNSIHL